MGEVVDARGRYDALHEDCPEAFVQQSSYWADAVAPLGPDEPVFLTYAENGKDLAGLPLYLYRHERGNILTSVPQPGPLGGVFCRENLDASARERAYEALLKKGLALARAEECLTLSIITSPFADDGGFYRRHLEPEYVFKNFTQSVPLSGGRKIGGSVAQNVKKAQAAGLSVSFCESDADFEAWLSLHARRQSEIGVAPLEPRLLRALRAVLEPRGKAALQLVKEGGGVVAGCLLVGHKRVVDVFMMTLDSSRGELEANYLSVSRSLEWARGRGASAYNWQSSPSREGGVYAFKKQWGSVETSYYFMTKRLCEPSRLKEIGPDGARAAYKNHYLAPFAALESGAASGEYEKK